MSFHKFGYNVESLQKDKIENLEKEFESETKIINIKLSDMQQSWLRMQSTFDDKLENIKETNFNDGETKVVVNAKIFLDINKDAAKLASQMEDIKRNLSYSEQDIKNRLLEKKKEILLDAANLDKEQQTILRNHFERNLMQSQQSCILELEKSKNQAFKDVIQLLYNTRLFDSFENKDQIFESYLTFSEEYLLEKYGKVIQTSDVIYYSSDLDYSTREDMLKCLKKMNIKMLLTLNIE